MIPVLGAVGSLTLVTKGPELEGKKQDYACNMHVFGKDMVFISVRLKHM